MHFPPQLKPELEMYVHEVHVLVQCALEHIGMLHGFLTTCVANGKNKGIQFSLPLTRSIFFFYFIFQQPYLYEYDINSTYFPLHVDCNYR